MSAVAELLAQLVALPTQQPGPDGRSGDELAFCTHVAPLLRRLGADAVDVGQTPRTNGSPGAYVFARWGTPRRVINAHLDTVPANAGWSRDPWQPAIVGDRLYGLGAADTKGAIAATLIALDGHAPRDLGVLFSGDEEAGSHVLRAFLGSPLMTGIREVIVCEPTARTAGIAHRGILGQHAVATGPGGHSSKSDHLPKPLADLARLATALDDAGRRRLHDGPADMQGTCLNLAALHGGVAFNVIAARAELVRPFVRSIGPLDFWTEAALYAAHGLDAIVIGPGDIAQAHGADEWVALADLDWAIELYRALLL